MQRGGCALVRGGAALLVQHSHTYCVGMKNVTLSYGDGAIVAAAEVLEANTLYTEDLNHGQLYGRVRVVNPFVRHESA